MPKADNSCKTLHSPSYFADKVRPVGLTDVINDSSDTSLVVNGFNNTSENTGSIAEFAREYN